MRAKLIIPFALVFLISISVIAGLAIVAAGDSDRFAVERSAKLVKSLLAAANGDLTRTAHEYSWWGETAENVVRTPDPDWADKYIGSYLFESFGITTTHVIDGDGRLIYAMVDGDRRKDDPFARFSGGLEILVERTRAAPKDEPPVPASGLLHDGGTVNVVSASVVTDYRLDGETEVSTATGAVLIIARRLDTARLGEFAEDYLLSDLHIDPTSASPVAAAVPLTLVDGSPGGAVIWRPDFPGEAMLYRLLPAVLGVFSILLFLTVLFVHRTRNAAHALERLNAAFLAEKEKAERYLAIAGTTIVAIERSGAISLVNNAGCRVLGRGEEELIGRNWIDTVVPADEKAQVESIFARILSGGAAMTKPVEYEVKTKDGERRRIAWHKIALTDDRGEVVGVLSSGEDLTERLEAERRMQQFRKLESLGSLAGGIAHEINNMLHPALSLTKATMRQLPPGSREWTRLEKATEASERIKGLVERILQFSAQPEFVREPVPLTPIVRDACGLLRSQALASVEFRAHLEDDVGFVIADPSEIQTVLINLGSNALDSMGIETGRLQVSLSPVFLKQTLYATIPPLEPGSYAKLSVTDNGAGMDKETVERLLEPFFTTKEVGHGTGLGLSIVFGIVAKQGGAIAISTSIGAGTTVDVYLPVVDGTVGNTAGEFEFAGRSSVGSGGKNS